MADYLQLLDSTQYLVTLVPKAIKGMVSGNRVLKYWVLGPSGSCKGTFRKNGGTGAGPFSRSSGVLTEVYRLGRVPA